ncbi:MAG: YbaB/EbfC family nucleoid-associated protein [Alphaproteobacteria bacterium]
MKGLENILKHAGEIQKKLEEEQHKLEKSLYEGAAGGGMVKVTLNGKADVKKVIIDPSIVNPNEKEIIEDLIVAAFNDAKRKVEDGMRNSMSGLVDGMPSSNPFLNF